MEGNAREWTSSPYTMAIKPDAGGVPPFAAPFAALFAWLELKSKYPKQLDTLQSLGGQATDTRVVKGGPEPTFLLQRTAFECRVSFREAWKATTRDETLGFRCAKNAP
jgi:formylglycine-generating enzyme required for sulfatase activity